ncbi:MAG: class I SAM-dependent methyltransferase [Candidatus Lokiarchaeota archaeon]|nr:class I SAM-dependent methyltransferase [Candidatus Lokiarchaeota archaeon]
MLTYNEFAQDYNNKRKRPWQSFIEFFDNLKNMGYNFNGTIIDLGCANGRHFRTIKTKKNRLIGIDSSIEFVNIAKERIKKDFKNKIDINKIQIILSDMNFLPFREKKINIFFSIATIHHIHTDISRRRLFSNLHYVMKNNAMILFSVWRRWQKKYRKYFLKDSFKRKLILNFNKKQIAQNLIDFGDINIPWNLASKKKVINRYYHFFSLKELKKLLRIFYIEKIRKLGGPGNNDNFFILAKKKYELTNGK